MEFFVTLALLLHLGHIISKFAPKKNSPPHLQSNARHFLGANRKKNPASGMDLSHLDCVGHQTPLVTAIFVEVNRLII